MGHHSKHMTEFIGAAEVTGKDFFRSLSSQSGPYFSPMLRPVYSNKAWVAEIVIGIFIVFTGLLFIIIQLARNKGGQGSVSIGLGIIVFGGLFVLLGYCWYKSLKEEEELHSDIISVCGDHRFAPGTANQLTVDTGTIV